MALYEDGITTQAQYIAIIEKEKQMNLGVRCNFMLPNHCQCPNTALTDSDMCELHKNELTHEEIESAFDSVYYKADIKQTEK